MEEVKCTKRREGRRKNDNMRVRRRKDRQCGSRRKEVNSLSDRQIDRIAKSGEIKTGDKNPDSSDA